VGAGVGTVVGVSAVRETSVGGVSVGNGGAEVSVGRRGGEVGAGEEQEEKRERKRRKERMRDVRCWDMQAILTEIIFLHKFAPPCTRPDINPFIEKAIEDRKRASKQDMKSTK